MFVIVVPGPKRPLFLHPFQRHGSHRHLLSNTPEQDPDQRPGNVVPDATDAGQNGSRLRDLNKEKRKRRQIDFVSYEKNK